MTPISWIAVHVDIDGIASVLDQALCALVAFATKGLQGTEDEFVPVTPVRLDVVSDDCRGDDAARKTEYA